VLLSGLSASGFAAAYLLGTLTWRAFGPPGFLVVVAYFVVVSLCRPDPFCITRNGLVYCELDSVMCGTMHPLISVILSFCGC
jgi:hypothetical protein